jgi:hypothetical protein
MTVEHTYRNYAIASYLVHGHTPWGHPLAHKSPPSLSDCGASGWIMCCGHVLTDDEAIAWQLAGIAQVADNPDRFGRRLLIAKPDGISRWLAECWEALSDGYEMAAEGDA